MSSKGVILLFLIAIVFFIVYISSSEQTTILSSSSGKPAGITIFAPMPGVQPFQPLLPEREGFTVKFGKTNVVSPMGIVSHVGTRVDASTSMDDCLPPPPVPAQAVESVDIQYRHGSVSYRESAASAAQVQAASAVAGPSGVRISSFNPLMII